MTFDVQPWCYKMPPHPYQVYELGLTEQGVKDMEQKK